MDNCALSEGYSGGRGRSPNGLLVSMSLVDRTSGIRHRSGGRGRDPKGPSESRILVRSSLERCAGDVGVKVRNSRPRPVGTVRKPRPRPVVDVGVKGSGTLRR